ncbi:MAG TPA: amidohydrolase family protein [Thermoanaerobaculia bacterium]|nr:amidohydrolase family protein [Thermoanaerobaculia bacterium]
MNRRSTFVLGAALLLGGAAAFGAAEPPPPEVIAVKAGRLIDPKAGTVVPGAVVVLEKGRVKAVGPSLPIPAGAKVVDLSALTVLPGLMDCHTHLVGDYVHDKDPLSDLKKSAADRAFESVPNARATLDAGFTTVRDVGTYRAFVDVAMRDAIARGDFPGPRMFVAGAYLTITGGGGAITGFAPDVTLPWDLRFGIADGVDQVRQRVRDIAQHDVDLIKVLATGAFLTHGSNPHAVEYTYDEIRAAVEEAAHKGLKVAAHAHSTEGIQLAVKAGVASIEHGTYLDDEGIRLMKEHGTYLVADIYDAEWIRQGAAAGYPEDFANKQPEADEIQRQAFRKAVQAGVKIAFGTDVSNFPHGLNARQFAWQVKYGQTPMQAIHSATFGASDLIGRDNDAGSLEPGKRADLIAVAGDPLQDVRILESVVFVMKDGKIFKDAR